MIRRLGVWLALLIVSGCGGPGVMEAQDPPSVDLERSNAGVEKQWRARVGSAGGLHHRLEPVLSGERVYAAGANGTLVAFEAATGDTVWRRRLEDRRLSGGPSVTEGLLAIGTRDGGLLGLAAENGEQRWQADVSSELLAPPAVGQGAVVARTNDGRVFAIDAEEGEQRWLYDRRVPPLTLRGHSSPVLVRGGVLVGFDNGSLVALKLSDGSEAWEATVALPSGGTDIERMVDVDGDPRVDGSQVFATSYQGRVVGLGLGDGQVAWTRDISSSKGPALDGDKVYISASNGKIWALDRTNGATVWQQEALNGLQLTAPRRYGDHVLVGGSDGYLYWLSPDDGRLVARRRVGDARIVAPPVTSDGWLYAQTAGGALVALKQD